MFLTLTDPPSGSAQILCNDTAATMWVYDTGDCTGSPTTNYGSWKLGCNQNEDTSMNLYECVPKFDLSIVPKGSLVAYRYPMGRNCTGENFDILIAPPDVCYAGTKTRCNETSWERQMWQNYRCTGKQESPQGGSLPGCSPTPPWYNWGFCYGV